MTLPELRNLTVRELISALERDGFFLDRSKGSHLRYRHTDGRQVTVPFHSSGATLRNATLHSILLATRWKEQDLRRLELIT